MLAFGAAHPDVHVEVAGPLHTLLAKAQNITRVGIARMTRNATGEGAAVGIVDTGIDPTLADFRDPVTHKSRIAWLIDMSMKPLGLHADLEKKYGVVDDQGNVTSGAVMTGDEIDALIAKNQPIPQDPNGHGTHVASIAAGNGGGTAYIGMAPKATLVVARVTRDASGTIDNGDTLQGAAFVFDRAAALGMPLAANFSLGTDFGPHDGNTLWEKTLASFAGANQPGHAIVAAMGNSGSIVDTPIHQAVELTEARVRVPITASGDVQSGSVQIWVALRAGADVRVGLDGPDGTWVSPISDGQSQAHDSSDYNSGVIFGSKAPNTLVPDGSHGAIVVWSGKWPKGTYAVTLEGHGYADLYLEGLGDASLEGTTPAYFSDDSGATRSVREATVNLPATSPGIISVGCSIDNPSWTSMGGQKIGITEPILDDYGGLPVSDTRQAVSEGEVCYFSSAGPTLTGVPKPDILAPGAVVVGAMSQAALPGSPNSIFTTSCPPEKGTGNVDPKCMEIDPTHAVALGTSMSSPMVAGVIALLFQVDPTLTEDELRAVLQAGAHHFRGSAPYSDSVRPGRARWDRRARRARRDVAARRRPPRRRRELDDAQRGLSPRRRLDADDRDARAADRRGKARDPLRRLAAAPLRHPRRRRLGAADRAGRGAGPLHVRRERAAGPRERLHHARRDVRRRTDRCTCNHSRRARPLDRGLSLVFRGRVQRVAHRHGRPRAPALPFGAARPPSPRAVTLSDSGLRSLGRCGVGARAPSRGGSDGLPALRRRSRRGWRRGSWRERCWRRANQNDACVEPPANGVSRVRRRPWRAIQQAHVKSVRPR